MEARTQMVHTGEGGTALGFGALDPALFPVSPMVCPLLNFIFINEGQKERVIRIKTHAEMTEVHDLTSGEPSDGGVGTKASRGWGRGSPTSSPPPALSAKQCQGVRWG